jgi:molybdenum cofactor cytidylyltransferase
MTPDSGSGTKFVGVVLAAGSSQRLGHPKQLVKVDGSPLIVRAASALLDVPDITRVVVVLGAHAAKIRPLLDSLPVKIIEISDWKEGLSRSLRTGIAEIQDNMPSAEAALFTLCDQPALDHQAIQSLVDTKKNSSAGIVAARYDGHPGAPCLVNRRYFEFLSQIEGDQGARALFSAVDPSEIALVDLPHLSLDLDAPEDLRQWRDSRPPEP